MRRIAAHRAGGLDAGTVLRSLLRLVGRGPAGGAAVRGGHAVRHLRAPAPARPTPLEHKGFPGGGRPRPPAGKPLTRSRLRAKRHSRVGTCKPHGRLRVTPVPSHFRACDSRGLHRLYTGLAPGPVSRGCSRTAR
ncbi:Hypothetical protein AA314_07310 [Archangium gephyra]|uniref:Uncharacterized protein n=1 Tax=Archangium gephyra TaxID=48 RepID=A0AAC8QDW7_9BACT|nr:Hypothetical protein AA314_07310 [Archangium gephyra]